jgi:hypothetical protein
MRIQRFCSALLIPVLLAGCMFGGDDAGPAAAPLPIRERPSGPITLTGPTPRETQACFTDLVRADIRYSPLPDRDFGGGCIVTGAVQLLDIGVPVSGLKSMRCPLARTFTAWVRYAVAPAAAQILGSELVKIESYGTYSCRGVIGRGTVGAQKMSEHGLGNAVDVAAFILADGRKVSVETGWRSEDPQVREFFETIHRSACKRFRTVLSPDYNAAHYNHMHLDMGKGPFCA